MKHISCDYFKFLDGVTPEITGLQPAIYFLNSKLNKETKELIQNNNIYLFYSIGPGCISKIRMSNDEVLTRLIVIDKTLTYDLLKFDPTEIAAEILHEVGHYLNSPPVEDKSKVEYYADDFARKNGLGLQLKNGLNKYINVIDSYTNEPIKRFFFKDLSKQNQIVKMINSRIERILNNAPILTGIIENSNSNSKI